VLVEGSDLTTSHIIYEQMGRRMFFPIDPVLDLILNLQIFILSAHSLRLTLPLGLNVCPPFHSIGKTMRPPSILAPARTVVEDETRRNSFWLAYATERQYGCGNGWALFLDDQDVSQLLPVQGDQFEFGASIFYLVGCRYINYRPDIDPCYASRAPMGSIS
jgi:hypothetical protein